MSISMTHSLTKSSKNTHAPPWPADTTTPISSPIDHPNKHPICQWKPLHLYFRYYAKNELRETVSTMIYPFLGLPELRRNRDTPLLLPFF
jgi:hypothetical protein